MKFLKNILLIESNNIYIKNIIKKQNNQRNTACKSIF